MKIQIYDIDEVSKGISFGSGDKFSVGFSLDSKKEIDDFVELLEERKEFAKNGSIVFIHNNIGFTIDENQSLFIVKELRRRK